jgi:nitroimidazol reductase NimA-like FMN-containing flavoprotein (pyridoxamine 5'-phosphate oxidase superfamily)
LAGHKVDAIRKCDKASFCVIEQDDVQPEKYTTFFRSVIAFGRIQIIEDEHEKLEVARMLGNRYNPNQDEALQKEIESGLSRMLAIRFDIEHLTGKEAIELVRGRQNND